MVILLSCSIFLDLFCVCLPDLLGSISCYFLLFFLQSPSQLPLERRRAQLSERLKQNTYLTSHCLITFPGFSALIASLGKPFKLLIYPARKF